MQNRTILGSPTVDVTVPLYTRNPIGVALNLRAHGQGSTDRLSIVGRDPVFPMIGVHGRGTLFDKDSHGIGVRHNAPEEQRSPGSIVKGYPKIPTCGKSILFATVKWPATR